MADLGETVTLNGVTYRTEAAHEAALREAVAVLKNGHAPAAGSPDGVLQVLARLDALRKTIEALREQPSTLALPVSLVQRLERIETAVDPKVTGARVHGIVENATRDLREVIMAAAVDAEGQLAGGLDALAARLKTVEEQQRLLVELLDTATAPPPPPARVPPQIVRPAPVQTPYRPEDESHAAAAPAPEVPADPTPFSSRADFLVRFLTEPGLTTRRLAQEWGVSDQTVANRLYKEAARRGPVAEAALRERMRGNRGRKPSRSARAGNAPAASTAAGTSR